MTAACAEPIRDETLLAYWCRDLPMDEADRIEEHLFVCSDCAARLERLSTLGTGIATLARTGRISGVISRALLNRLQREGVNLRIYSLAPGETVACAAFPSDDLLIAALRADLAGVEAVHLSVLASAGDMLGGVIEAPVRPLDHEVLWATPGALVRRMPSTRLQLTLSTTGDRRVLGEYVLDHSATP